MAAISTTDSMYCELSDEIFGRKDGKLAVKVLPKIVDFRRLLRSKFSVGNNISNQDLLHAVVALYKKCLPHSDGSFYDCVCDKWSNTLLLLRDYNDVAAEINDQVGSRVTNTPRHDCTVIKHENHHIKTTDKNITSVYNDYKCTPNKHLAQQLGHTNDVCYLSDCITGDCSGNKYAANVKTCQRKLFSENLCDVAQGLSTGLNSGTSQQSEECHEVEELNEQQYLGCDDEERHEDNQIFHENNCDRCDVYSDADESESETYDSDDDEDFSVGYDDFVKAVQKRRRARKYGNVPCEKMDIGPESLLIGCGTFQRAITSSGEKLMQLTLLAVRKPYRKMGVASFIINKLKSWAVYGSYTALLVYAEKYAVDYFKKHGFNYDVILNSIFDETQDEWLNCIRMIYLPPYTSVDEGVSGTVKSKETSQMDKALQNWRSKSLEAYRFQTICILRMKEEISKLKTQLSEQRKILRKYKDENEELREKNIVIEKELRNLQISADLEKSTVSFSDIHLQVFEAQNDDVENK